AGNSGAALTRCEQLVPMLQAAVDSTRRSPAAAVAIATPQCMVTVVSGQAVAADSLFRIGSETKMYIAATILSLAHDGKISLGDTLDRWTLPVPNGSGITVRQLLNHTSGIYNYTEDPGFQDPATRQTEQRPEALVALATQHPPYFAPGTGWRYSNTNYILLGM